MLTISIGPARTGVADNWLFETKEAARDFLSTLTDPGDWVVRIDYDDPDIDDDDNVYYVDVIADVIEMM